MFTYFGIITAILRFAVSAPLGGGVQTNNRAEYMAVAEALRVAKERKYAALRVCTDSKLLVC